MASRHDLSELKRDPEALVARAASGEEIVITIDGLDRARLLPPRRRTWLPWDEVAHLVDGPADHEWLHDRALVDQEL